MKITNEQIEAAHSRVAAYVQRRKQSRGLDIDAIHGFDVSPTSGFELTLTDIETLLAASAQQAAGQDGWQLVPKEPTPAMLAEIHMHPEFTQRAMFVRYQAMLAAAPQPATVSAAPSGDLIAAAERMRKAHIAALVPAKLPAHAEALEYQCAVQALISAATKE